MMAIRLLLSLCLTCVTGLASQAPTHPDFSGSWAFDRAKSAQPWNGRIVIAPILGDACVMTQDATSLNLAITAGGQNVRAVYRFTGESRNLSPGDIPVTSRTSWDGDKLVIVSTSTGTVNGQSVTIESRRVLRIDKDGDLIVERTGTPPSEVTPSRSVYTRVR
jgi:hypothetical protein